jgi:nucleoside-triphosphatase
VHHEASEATASSRRRLLLTGRPGAGKTTVIRTVAMALTGRWGLGGFYTEEVRGSAGREGFRLITFDGRRRLLAHVSFDARAGRVGKYGVDVAMLDQLAATALKMTRAVDVYLVDEIGKMECLSPRFVSAMRALFEAPAPVVATVAQRGRGFIAEVKQRRDALVWEVTASNRDALPERVVTWLSSG